MKKITPPYKTSKGLSPKLVWMNNNRIRLEFKGSYLKQEDKAASIQKMWSRKKKKIYCL